MYSKICNICPHRCNREHKTVCQQNELNMDENFIQSTTVAIDPIEKKPLYHFQPGTDTLSIGTLGCNLKCLNCQNHSIAQPEYPEQVPITEFTPQEIVQIAKKYRLNSISWTYNEPTIHPEWIINTAKEARKKNIYTIVVSNGYNSSKTIDELVKYVDAVNIDIKSMDNEFYTKICGATLDPVLETVEKYFRNKVHIEITNLVIPGYNDSAKLIKELAQFISSLSNKIPLHLSAFYPQFKMMDVDATSEKIIDKVCNIAKHEGLKYVYPGNVSSTYKSNTYCPNCKELLIKRDLYDVKDYITEQNACPHCNHKVDVIY